jgi:cobalt-zinc-cadmium efflux system outer membrane protein
MRHAGNCLWKSQNSLAMLLALACLVIIIRPILADPPPVETKQPIPETLTLNDAIILALERNPELASFRQQRGIAAAAVVIAETYPFNPVWEGRVQANSGPASAGITNTVANEHVVLTELEIRGQGIYRREAAYAAQSRTDWEIAHQEILLSIRVIRGFQSMLYRQEKVDLLNQIIELDQRTLDLVGSLVKQGRLHGPDEILARTELNDVQAQLGAAQANLVTAQYELRRSLGIVTGQFKPQGKLETPLLTWKDTELLPVAWERRADRRGREMATAEAEADLRLERANRFGNPTFGPAYTYDPTRVSEIGAQLNLPIPVFNTRRGQILQREAELERARLDLRQIDVSIQQDIQAALARLERANALVYRYQKEILPTLETAVKELEKLLKSGDPNVNVLHVIDTRRKELKARDGYLDALWELWQARADLAAAIGDPALAVLSWNPEDKKDSAPKPAK